MKIENYKLFTNLILLSQIFLYLLGLIIVRFGVYELTLKFFNKYFYLCFIIYIGSSIFNYLYLICKTENNGILVFSFIITTSCHFFILINLLYFFHLLNSDNTIIYFFTTLFFHNLMITIYTFIKKIEFRYLYFFLFGFIPVIIIILIISLVSFLSYFTFLIIFLLYNYFLYKFTDECDYGNILVNISYIYNGFLIYFAFLKYWIKKNDKIYLIKRDNNTNINVETKINQNNIVYVINQENNLNTNNKEIVQNNNKQNNNQISTNNDIIYFEKKIEYEDKYEERYD